MSRAASGFFWLTVYLVVVLAPLFLMLLGPVPSGRDLLTEFSVALGFVGLTQLAVQFVLIARFRRITAPYGIDLILQYHKQIALVAVLLILAHPVILVVQQPWRLELLNPLRGNWASRFALLSLLSLLLIVVVSVWRKPLKINYEAWRVSHLVLSLSALVFAQLHVALAGLYTNTWWKHALWIVISAAMVGVVIYLRLIKPVQQWGHPYRVTEVKAEQGETTTLTLEPDGHPGLSFLPGQFAWLKLGRPYTVDEHPYSFASSAETPGRLSFGIKALGDFSSSIKDVEVGSPAYVDGPHGAFSIDRYQAPGYIFVAGGVGITPFMSFLHTMRDRKDPRPVLFFYAGKDEESLTYRDEIDALKRALDLEVVYVLEEPPEGGGYEEGFVTPEVLSKYLSADRLRRQTFVCGPPAMMEAVQDALREVGIPREKIQMEQFDLV